MQNLKCLCNCFLLCSLLGFTQAVWAVNQVHISVEKLQTPEGMAQSLDLKVNLAKKANATLKAKLKPQTQQEWVFTRLTCKIPNRWHAGSWRCYAGKFKAKSFSLPFSLDFKLLTTKQKVNGIDGKLQLTTASFSDAAGLHAAEDLTVGMTFTLTQAGQQTKLKYALNWQSGEMYWDPIYIKGEGHQIQGNLVMQDQLLIFKNSTLDLKKVGKLHLDGEYDLEAKSFKRLAANLPDLDLQTAFPIFFKPFLTNSVLQQTDLQGRVAFNANLLGESLSNFDLKLNNVTLEDQHHHFGFTKLNAHIPWDYDQVKSVKLSYEKGHLRNLPLGPANITAKVNRFAWTAPKITLPILDGALQLRDISAARISGKWYWHLGADIENLGMPTLSNTLGWPEMQGQAAVHIPQVTYGNERLIANGEMVFKVFDGQTTVTNLEWLHPLGDAPAVYADLAMRQLDLGKLTDTFSFGSIEGRLDGDVKQLVLQNGQPVKFDANFVSSPGDYRQKISQKAVENISALGGAGAVAAIQRSVLRFFKAFNYAKIGLSCRLSNNVCAMGGIPTKDKPSTDRGYIIVKGRGVPAITVKGYNHQVSWDVLLGRIKRIMNENNQVIVE